MELEIIKDKAPGVQATNSVALVSVSGAGSSSTEEGSKNINGSN